MRDSSRGTTRDSESDRLRGTSESDSKMDSKKGREWDGSGSMRKNI